MTLRFPIADHSAALAFGGNRLDRMSERREDEPFIAGIRGDPAGRAYLFAKDLLVTKGDGGAFAFTRPEAEALGVDWQAAVFLGLDAEGPLFAAAIAAPAEDAGFALTNLRPLAISGAVDEERLGQLAQASSILGWHARHGFCANCGTATTVAQAGMRRDCPNCGTNHFPRTDPVVIMLAVDGERCLLGRQTRFVEGVYSCLAGFMEPGETIEAAVRREIWEEAGIRTDRVAYFASQPWPFPSNLMIGCFAEATSFDVDPRDKELEDVRWFDRADILPMLERTHTNFATPPKMAIAHHLLRAYAIHGAPVADDAALGTAATTAGALA
ncbi:NAD(+) diphosphatase [Acuticoccus mangrovi]|uniref:NAD(+) diphosphatase n=1 Tax=Acuticoccus mangrovi TaxID=2796142 RepID=A0A934MDX5_9HYPH|nr:NAD(+) diphosphatase [Acuticoccus mangrovi]MBJ3776862.1 NAD(+) diphosphatase [Acuticoccus mangrovi]